MITQKIKAPFVVERWTSYPPHGGYQQQHRPQQHTHPNLNTPSQVQTPAKLDKQSYIKFIENVKLTYSVGDLCTFKNNVMVPQRLPVVYRLTYIEELHDKASIDMTIGQPQCLVLVMLGMKPENADKIYTPWTCAPARLRKLTPEEIDLVNLSHLPAQVAS